MVVFQTEKICAVFPFTDDIRVGWYNAVPSDSHIRSNERIEKDTDDIEVIADNGDTVNVVGEMLSRLKPADEIINDSIMVATIGGAGVDSENVEAKVCGNEISLYSGRLSLEHNSVFVNKLAASYKGAKLVVAGEERRAVYGQKVSIVAEDEAELFTNERGMNISGRGRVMVGEILVNKRLYERIPGNVWGVSLNP